jgi:DNA-directed RNA polymerase subunit RPC12/RpoP
MVANRISFGAIAALHGIDPEDDGDIYLVKPDWSAVDYPEDELDNGMDRSMTPGAECPECGLNAAEGASFCHGCGAGMPVPEESDDNNMECESCGAKGCPEGANNCHMCGKPLSQSVTKNAIGCTTCGESTPQDAMYCPTCGDPVPQAESEDSVSNQTKEEVTVSDNQTAAETSAEESVATPAARLMTDADLQAFAAMIIAANTPIENAPEEETPEVAPEAEVEAPAEAPAEEAPEVEVAAEESDTSKENEVSENLFTAEQVAAMIAEAAKAAVVAAKADAVESYRAGEATRKGLVGGTNAFDAAELLESDEIDPALLAEMTSTQFRKVQTEVWGSTPFFAAKFAQADRGF